MYLVQTMAEAKTIENVTEICQFYRTVVEPAMRHEGGLLESTCSVDLRDPLRILLSEQWGSLGAFRWWRNSPLRQQMIQQLRPWITGSVSERIYKEIS